jgi:hypothetical protein
MKILLLVTLGLTIGVLSGTLGIGGGVLLLPALMWLFDLKQGQAAGITLAVLSVPVTLPGVWRYYDYGVIQGEHLRMAAWIAGAFAVGTFLGASVHNHLPAPLLRVGFGLLMIYVAVRLIMQSSPEVAITAAGVSALTVALWPTWACAWWGSATCRRLTSGTRSALPNNRGAAISSIISDTLPKFAKPQAARAERDQPRHTARRSFTTPSPRHPVTPPRRPSCRGARRSCAAACWPW